MKVKIIEQPVTVYREADANSPIITQLAVGQEIELGGVKKVNGESWVRVNLAPNQSGYIPGSSRIYHIKQAILNQRSVNVYSLPSSQSAVKTQYKRNTKFHLTDVIKQDGRHFVKIRDMTGDEGFIEGGTKIKIVPEKAQPTKASARKNMIYGALWCIGGIVVTVATYSAASGGGTYIVAWGAILFGGLQLLSGIYQYFKASD